MPQQQEGADDDRGKRAPKERKKSCGRGRPGLDLVVIDNGSKRIKCLVGSVTLAKWTPGQGAAGQGAVGAVGAVGADSGRCSCAGGSSRWQHRHTLHSAHCTLHTCKRQGRQASDCFSLFSSNYLLLAISTTYLLLSDPPFSPLSRPDCVQHHLLLFSGLP